MFEAVRSNKRFAQVVLAILIVPFAFFGMDAYFTDGPAGNEVATVGDSKIYAVEFEEALREQQARLREAMGGQVDRAMLDSLELRRAVIDNLVNQRLLALYAAENRLVVTQQQLAETIAEVPAFQDNGRFSMERYEALLRAQGMSPAGFEARLSQDIRIQQLALAVGEGAFAAEESARRFLLAQLEEREVRELAFSAADHVAGVSLDEGAAQAFYDANAQRFELPARVRAEYVVFDQAAVLAGVNVSDAEVRAFYEASAERFGVPEERRARHILLEVSDAADAEAVRAEAVALIERLRAEPTAFAALARERSADPGSAARGGDLGFFGRGVMVQPFEEAVFGAQPGLVAEPVQSDYGFHVIEVTEIRAAALRPFEEVRDELAAELKSRTGGQRFAELAEQFANTVYEQADSLAPAAEQFGLQIQVSDWIPRGSAAIGPYRNEGLVDALFGHDALTEGRNVDAVDVGNSTLVAARVLEHQAAQRRPFEEVKAGIENELRLREAAARSVAAGEAALAALQRGESVDGRWSDAATVQRGAPLLAPEAMQAVFSAPTATLPAYVGVSMGGEGYAVYRIEAVRRPELAGDDPRLAAMTGQYGQLLGERDFSAFINALRERYKVSVREAAIRPQQQ